jgi:hypothetical protein
LSMSQVEIDLRNVCQPTAPVIPAAAAATLRWFATNVFARNGFLPRVLGLANIQSDEAA